MVSILEIAFLLIKLFWAQFCFSWSWRYQYAVESDISVYGWIYAWTQSGPSGLPIFLVLCNCAFTLCSMHIVVFLKILTRVVVYAWLESFSELWSQPSTTREGSWICSRCECSKTREGYYCFLIWFILFYLFECANLFSFVFF